MAIIYGVNATKHLAKPMQLSEQGEQGGKVHVIFDTYELTAARSAGDVLYMGGLIPAGARVIEAKLFYDALDASGGDADLGWLASADGVEAVDADGFIDGADVTAAGATIMSDDQPTRPGFLKKFSSAVQPTVTATASGGWDSTSGTVSVLIEYVVD